MKNRTRSGHGRGAVSWRTPTHLLINIIYIRYVKKNIYITYIIREARCGRVADGGCTRGEGKWNGGGGTRWRNCVRREKLREKERKWRRQKRERKQCEGGRRKDIYDIHGDIYLWELPVRTESDPRRRDTRQSQNIWDELISFTLFPLPKLLLGTWFRHNVASICGAAKSPRPDPAELTVSFT